jgi:hypothetical protein
MEAPSIHLSNVSAGGGGGGPARCYEDKRV